MWIRDSSIGSLIASAWPTRPQPSTLSNLMSKIKVTKMALKWWNHAHFGNVHTNIQNLKTHIDHLQAQPQTSLVIQMERNAQEELDEILLRERILWKEKAKTKWLEEGDANTRFFHLSTIIHRRKNYIPYILDCHNSKVTDPCKLVQLLSISILIYLLVAGLFFPLTCRNWSLLQSQMPWMPPLLWYLVTWKFSK